MRYCTVLDPTVLVQLPLLVGLWTKKQLPHGYKKIELHIGMTLLLTIELDDLCYNAYSSFLHKVTQSATTLFHQVTLHKVTQLYFTM